jgi:hypothetical protein
MMWHLSIPGGCSASGGGCDWDRLTVDIAGVVAAGSGCSEIVRGRLGRWLS